MAEIFAEGYTGAMALDRPRALGGTLLGTALGDALGLACEGLSARTIARRFGKADRFRLLGRTGFVSDDTELAALTAQALALFPNDPERCAAAFRRSLAGWLLRLPWGVGLATLRAGGKALLGLRETGVASAGNGACTRAPIVGAFFASDPAKRRAFGEALARVTHTDPRAVEAALFAAEVAASASYGVHPEKAVEAGLALVTQPELKTALEKAAALAAGGATLDQAAGELGVTGYSVHTAALAAFCFARWGADPLLAIQKTIAAGGDTDSIAALVGAWAGALSGEEGLDHDLMDALCGGPFGRAHLRALASALAHGRPPPRYAWPLALARNLALYPVILGHGLRRLLP